MNYGKAIKDLRDKLLITQTEFANLINVSYASVNRWENKHCQPTMKAKRKITDVCKKNHVKIEE